MKLSQPYYIEPREKESAVDLNGNWDFCWVDEECENIDNLKFDHTTKIPSSIYYSLSESNILPHPYYGTNSKEYYWVDEKIWYYRKKFVLGKKDSCHNAFLCFDGVAYYSRVWVNGVLIGEHEGMFGGPSCDVCDHLNFGEENEIIVEVKSCNYGKKEGYNIWDGNNDIKEIVPWNISRDGATSNGDFIVIGIWNNVRLELLDKIHISRPYMYTKSISEDKAVIHFETEIADGNVKELKPYFDYSDTGTGYNWAFRSGVTGKETNEKVTLEIEISDLGETVYESIEDVSLTDFENLGIKEKYFELQFYRKEIELKNPKLWYPNGIGEPFLYDVNISVSKGGVVCDKQSFKFGVRTFEADFGPANKYRTHWGKYSFSINGKNIFLKGMNWTPIDFLYDISPEKYKWCLNLVKNAGIQLIRVWNGGGMPESDVFYELCDKMGIMVWQDLFIANQGCTRCFPHDILENQIAYNLYRIRNHPSLTVICGGNEFNPYSPDNASSMFITQRNVDTLIPDRVFYYTTDDRGSAHLYNDMEPAWYRHYYKQLSFIGESGIHSFPNYVTVKKFVCHKEANAMIPNLSSPEFYNNFPELLNHFSEYSPERVPRMTARISQIIDLNNVTIRDICEASQVQVFEYYQFMIQSAMENYPVCGGIMPWVFKRPWPTVAIQTVDGDDRPCYGYYAVLGAYKNINVCWVQNWTILAPGEELPLEIKIFNQNNEDLFDCRVSLTIFNPDLSVFKKFEEDYKPLLDFGKITLDDRFKNSCFLVCADISRNGASIARTVYFNKCTTILSDKELYSQHRSKPSENLYFSEGPWLKPIIENANTTKLKAVVCGHGTENGYSYADVVIENISDFCAYPVTLELMDERQRFFLNENFFMLMPGETKKVRITCDKGRVDKIKINHWNGEAILV